MIPFGSQRASGQDLATHLLNAHDNEQVELASVRGAVARDLHGAVTEWEAQAHALTRCQKYLYSLSINPDPRQGPLTRDQYEDYIARVEDRLGLDDQPRAVVFHTKNGREHCHVVWSRIDAENGKAVQLSYDREKLMAVTREFARDHELRLPDGYYREGDERQQGDQLSLYEKAQQDRTGLTKEQRTGEVTAAWRQSDSAKAFVRALEEHGYILANGKRPYVLVDRYGEMNALPKLIDDKTVRTKDVRAFLEKDFPPDKLPSVNDARQQAAQRRKAREDFERSRGQSDPEKQDRGEQLKVRQAQRRQPLEKQNAALIARQAAETLKLAARQHDEKRRLEGTFRDAMERLQRSRDQNRPTGLAGFLGRVTGMNFLVRALRVQQDVRRQRKHEQEKARLAERHKAEQRQQAQRHQMQTLEITRRLHALARVEQRERQSLDTRLLRESRETERRDTGRGSVDRTPDRKGKKDKPRDHDDRYYPDIAKAFAKAADDGRSGGDDDGGGDSGGRNFKSVFKNRGHTYKGPGKGKGKDHDPDLGR
ncbi:MAG: relaxase/mobilization nuclease domain-containing protein [Hyphomonas sp.]|nr:relaxase/mobilization nuclease domain-containing protein [Hyphomonas sp.]